MAEEWLTTGEAAELSTDPRKLATGSCNTTEPTDLDRRFIEIRQWLTAEGEYSDLIVEQGLLQDGDLQTETMVLPFHYSVDQALDSLNGRKGK
jgi:hypothetical protein